MHSVEAWHIEGIWDEVFTVTYAQKTCPGSFARPQCIVDWKAEGT